MSASPQDPVAEITGESSLGLQSDEAKPLRLQIEPNLTTLQASNKATSICTSENSINHLAAVTGL